ncbi:hypothetical protein KC19_8G070500 [Ceratodon purpureus]|uniref:Galactose oxidase n=1 Tax=Ceratodon purpureus TaxID=3225 RepID=A0A8T0GW02_CERPU|nr:hypothetical protein KC19_8G070500 [Ceratodon purpureus]
MKPGSHFKDIAFWLVLVTASLLQLVDAQGGTWELLLKKAGIASMHTMITHYNTAIMLDRTNIGKSQIKLPNGRCRNRKDEQVLKHDCTAHSVMFDLDTNTVRALYIETDTWCSSGQFQYDGTMIQTGGDKDGVKKIRALVPCPADGNCDWHEYATSELEDPRWYATNQILPDGKTQIVIGGRKAYTYEFVPKRNKNEVAFDLKFLKDTKSPQDDNMYPFVHLLPDGNLYIFANRDSIVLNYKTNKVVRKFPVIPGEPRNYPSAGSSVMLPLLGSDDFAVVEVLVCGGAKAKAYRNVKGQYPCSITCGRMTVTDKKPEWVMEDMPMRRCMSDMTLLPNGDVIIINGAGRGSQGWERASKAVYNPVKYATYDPTARFETLAASEIARVYHSTSNLLTDGRILVAGSNTHEFYTFTGKYPTELRVEAFSPPYLAAGYNDVRPAITDAPGKVGYGDTFAVTFKVTVLKGALEMNMKSSPFVTHSYAMGQRMLKLKATAPVAAGAGFTVDVTAPPTAELAPPGYYMLFPVQNRIPGRAVWVQIG